MNALLPQKPGDDSWPMKLASNSFPIEQTALEIRSVKEVTFANEHIPVTSEELSKVFSKAMTVLIDEYIDVSTLLQAEAEDDVPAQQTIAQRIHLGVKRVLHHVFKPIVQELEQEPVDTLVEERALEAELRREIELLSKLAYFYVNMDRESSLHPTLWKLYRETLIRGRTLMWKIANKKERGEARDALLQDLEQMVRDLESFDEAELYAEVEERILLFQNDILSHIRDAKTVYEEMKLAYGDQLRITDEEVLALIRQVEEPFERLLHACEKDKTMFDRSIADGLKQSVQQAVNAMNARISSELPLLRATEIPTSLPGSTGISLSEVMAAASWEADVDDAWSETVHATIGFRGYMNSIKGEFDRAEFIRKLQLQKQYEHNISSYAKAGIIERLSDGRYGISAKNSVTGKEYPLPELSEIYEMFSPRFLLKLNQGFHKMVLVPMGMKSTELFKKYKALVLRHFMDGTLTDSSGEKISSIHADFVDPVFMERLESVDPKAYFSIERKECLVSYGGFTQAMQLEEGREYPACTIDGWNVEFLPEDYKGTTVQRNGDFTKAHEFSSYFDEVSYHLANAGSLQDNLDGKSMYVGERGIYFQLFLSMASQHTFNGRFLEVLFDQYYRNEVGLRFEDVIFFGERWNSDYYAMQWQDDHYEIRKKYVLDKDTFKKTDNILTTVTLQPDSHLSSPSAPSDS